MKTIRLSQIYINLSYIYINLSLIYINLTWIYKIYLLSQGRRIKYFIR